MRACVVEGCTEHSRRKSGLCEAHDKRARRGAPLDAPVQRRRRDAWARVKRAAEDYAKAATTLELIRSEERLAMAAQDWAWGQKRP